MKLEVGVVDSLYYTFDKTLLILPVDGTQFGNKFNLLMMSS